MKYLVQKTNDPEVLARLNRTVQQLHAELFPDEFKPFDLDRVEQAFANLLAERGVHAFVAIEDEEPIGYLLCMKKTRDANAFQYAKTVLLIDQIAVEDAHRHSGVATQLFEHAVALAREQGIAEIQVEQWEGNTAMTQFLSKQGFHRLKQCWTDKISAH